MKIIGVIPARWASSRFPGKVLSPLAGKPIIQHVWESAKKSLLLTDLIIACDEDHVLKAAQGFGAKVSLTSRDHPSGSDRIAEVIKDLNVDIVVNIQGDEPLIHHSVIDRLAQALVDDRSAPMATVIKKISQPDELENPNVVKAVIDQKKFALYFSRSVIPFNREKKSLREITYYKHLGIYAYRKDFLFTFKDLPKSKLEEIEKLEQLRVLEAGYKIKTVETDLETIGIDTPEDLLRVEKIFAAK